MSNGSGNQSNSPKPLEWLDAEPIPQSGQDIVHLKLKLIGQSGVEKYEISQREFVHWLRDQVLKFDSTFENQLLAVLRDISGNLSDIKGRKGSN